MRVIRKYPNRRLYDTETGSFINLRQLRELIEQGVELRVQEKDGGADITRSLLLQIIVDADESGRPILSETLLRQLIRFHGHALQDFMTRYLEQSVELFLGQVDDMQSRIGDVLARGPLAAMQELGRQNLRAWERLWRGSDEGDRNH